MLTRKEMCQIYLIKAQQKFGKSMSELDIYYAGPEVGIALSYLGLIQDHTSIEYIKSAPCTLYKHTNGKELSYLEFLSLLPETTTNNTVTASEVKKPSQAQDSLTEEQIKEFLGDRKYYRICDAIENFQKEDLVAVAQLLKLRFDEFQSPAT